MRIFLVLVFLFSRPLLAVVGTEAVVASAGKLGATPACTADEAAIIKEAETNCQQDDVQCLTAEKNRLKSTADTEATKCSDAAKTKGAEITANASQLRSLEIAEIAEQNAAASSVADGQAAATSGARSIAVSGGRTLSSVSGGLTFISNDASSLIQQLQACESSSQKTVNCMAGKSAAAELIAQSRTVAASKSASAMEMMQMASMGTGILTNLKSLFGDKGGSGISGVKTPPSATMTNGATLSGSKLGIGTGAAPEASQIAAAAGYAGFGTSGASSSKFASGKLIDYKADPFAKKNESGISDKSDTGVSNAMATGGTGGAEKTPEAKILDKGADGDLATLDFGGGGGRPSMLGLKGGSKELDGLVGTLDDTKKPNLDMGADGRALASADSGGVSTDPEMSIFNVVHLKLSDMKKRGFL